MKKLLTIFALIAIGMVASASKTMNEEPICGDWSEWNCFIEEGEHGDNDILVCTRTRLCCYAGNVCWVESTEKEVAP